jgi:hypothetical protein
MPLSELSVINDITNRTYHRERREAFDVLTRTINRNCPPMKNRYSPAFHILKWYHLNIQYEEIECSLLEAEN